MKMYTIIVLLVLVAGTVACPLWTLQSNSSNECHCGDAIGGVVSCNHETKKVSLLYCYCMTYNQHLNQTAVGFCLTMCTSRDAQDCQLLNQISANDTHELNKEMCRFVNRAGQLCGSCLPGYGLPVYSHAIHCTECNESEFSHNLLKYVVIAFLPLTAFYFIVILFKINITSGNMVGYVLTCQLLATPTLIRAVIRPENYPSMGTRLMAACLSVWNLDFFRVVYDPFCIHPNMNILHALTLDYIVGTYPLFLIMLTYFAVTLHDRYSVMVKIWQPAYRVFMCLRKEWDIRGSLIQAFATFLVLSYVKILNVSFDLLYPVTLVNSSGHRLDHTYLFNNAQMIYFGEEHLPYGILAITMFTIFNFLPVVLMLVYPCACFQRCLTVCKIRGHVLATFMDAFQGCYRDRPRDYRYFAAVYFIIRIFFVAAIMIVKDGTILVLYGCLYVNLSLIVVFLEPYKIKYHHKIDVLLLLLNAQGLLTGCLTAYLRPGVLQAPLHYMYVFTVMPAAIVMITYGGAIILYKVTPQALKKAVKKCLCVMIKCKQKGQENEEQFPYRFEQENESTPLLKHNGR